MTLEILKDRFAVCKTDSAIEIDKDKEFFSITVTRNEISLVCTENNVPKDCTAQTGFRAMRVKGTLEFSLTGILAKISGILADEKISIFALSTYETDYIFVDENDLEKGISALENGGYIFENK
jgi:hypothetical protein